MREKLAFLFHCIPKHRWFSKQQFSLSTVGFVVSGELAIFTVLLVKYSVLKAKDSNGLVLKEWEKSSQDQANDNVELEEY